jgi:hypothetical protein
MKSSSSVKMIPDAVAARVLSQDAPFAAFLSSVVLCMRGAHFRQSGGGLLVVDGSSVRFVGRRCGDVRPRSVLVFSLDALYAGKMETRRPRISRRLNAHRQARSVRHARRLFRGCIRDSRSILHRLDFASRWQQENRDVAGRARDYHGGHTGGRPGGLYRAVWRAHDPVGQPTSTARFFDGAAFFALFLGADFLCFAVFAIAFSTALSTTFAVMPLCTAFLTAFSIAFSAFFSDFFFAMIPRNPRISVWHACLTLLVVEHSLPSASPALMRSRKLFIVHSFLLAAKTFLDRAQCGAFSAAFNNARSL